MTTSSWVISVGRWGASEEHPLPSYRMAPIKAKRKKNEQT